MERDKALFKMFGKFYLQGTILFKENDPGEEMYYIQSGSVRLTSGDGSSSTVKTLIAGDILGEDALLERAQRRAIAEVIEDSRLLVIDSRNIDALVRNGPELSASIMGELMKCLDKSWDVQHQWLMSFFLGKLEVFFRREQPEGGFTIDEVSEQTEIEKGGVRLVFEKLVQAGALEREGEAFRLTDLNSLERIARELEQSESGES